MRVPIWLASAVAVTALVALAWMLRWERLHGTTVGVFILDRWTGDVYFASGYGRIKLPRVLNRDEGWEDAPASAEKLR